MGTRQVILGALVLSTLVTSVYTYEKIYVAHDYIVQYDAPCTSGSCFVRACPDDEPVCIPETFLRIEKKAYDLLRACGPDIRECISAYTCNSDDSYCHITQCDSATEECAR
jgi:hypothetical protein